MLITKFCWWLDSNPDLWNWKGPLRQMKHNLCPLEHILEQISSTFFQSHLTSFSPCSLLTLLQSERPKALLFNKTSRSLASSRTPRTRRPWQAWSSKSQLETDLRAKTFDRNNRIRVLTNGRNFDDYYYQYPFSVTSDRCYKVFWGDLENLDFPIKWNNKKGNLKSNTLL